MAGRADIPRLFQEIAHEDGSMCPEDTRGLGNNEAEDIET